MSSPPRARPLKPAKDGSTAKQTISRKRNPSARISAACEACKKRKTKCTGGPPPCQLCESLETECIIDPSLDMRRRAALQRTIDESKSYQESLTGLIDCLREGESSLVESLIQSLQRDTQAQDVSATIQRFTRLIRGRDTGVAVGNDEDLISPSDESIEIQHTFPYTPSLPGSGDDQYDHRTLETLRSGSSSGQKGKETELSGYYRALLQQLRSTPSADGERILCNLISSNSLMNFFLRSPHELSLVKTIDDPGLIGSEGTLALMDLGDKRQHWHPALQVGPDTTWPQQSSSGSRVLASVSNSQITPDIQADVDGQDTTGSRSQSEEGHQDAPINIRPDVNSGRSQNSKQNVSPARIVSRTPYTEPSGTPLMPGNTDLCIAHEDPGHRWRVPMHLVQPPIVPDGSPICRVYTEYLQGAQKMLSNGTAVVDVLGPDDDVIVDLLFRQRRPDDRWDCSSWACELFRSFSEYDVYVRLANAYYLTCFMRWLLVPTSESYAKLPDMMKPTPTQRLIPHIGAIDLIPIPCIRDAAIANLRDWLTPLAKARWTVNWPFAEQDAMERKSNTESTRLSQRFIEHILKYENWSIGSSFLAAFPEVAGRITIHP